MSIALVQLFLGLVAAYFLTERWQRWRQRREFQYRTMTRLSETSMELFVLLSELLSLHPVRMSMPDAWDEKQRRYISQRVVFHALEADIMASFTGGDVLGGYLRLNTKAQALFVIVQSTATVTPGLYEPTQNEFLAERKELLGRMIAEMKLVSWRERRALRSKQKKSGAG